MRALVTGGQGFVGRHLDAHLRAAGDAVVSTDAECDVADLAAVSAVVARAQPDVLYHLAAISHVGDSWEDPTDVLRVNVLGTAVVLAALRAHAPRARALVVSSAAVYGAVREVGHPLSESTPPRPTSPYAASKLAAEAVAVQAALGFSQDVVIVRPFNHTGPGQSPAFAVPGIAARLLAARARGERTVAVGNLEARRDFSDVRDVVRSYRLLAERGVTGEVYNVASGVDRSMADVAEALRAIIDPAVTFVSDPALLRPADSPVLCGDVAKLHAATGWEPSIDFATTLADVVASLSAT